MITLRSIVSVACAQQFFRHKRRLIKILILSVVRLVGNRVKIFKLEDEKRTELMHVSWKQ